MDNLGKSFLVAIGIGAFVLSAFVIDIVPTSESMARNLTKKDRNTEISSVNTGIQNQEYAKIGLVDLPQVVKSAVISKYIAYSIEEVFQNNEDYKIILKSDMARLIVYYDGVGEYLKQEVVKPVQLVSIFY